MKYTPLHRAAQRSQAKVASLLLEWGVDANERNDDKKTAFRIAEDAKDFATARILGRHTDVKDEEQENVVIDDCTDLEAPNGSSSSLKSKGKEAARESRQLQRKAARYVAPAFWLVCVSM